MAKLRFVIYALIGTAACCAAAQTGVHVQAPDLHGPRQLNKETGSAVVRDYLQSWESLKNAFDSNRTDLLDTDYVGEAKKRLSDAVRSQTSLGLNTRYSDITHDIQIVFYSPEGLSIELTDTVHYSVKIFKQGKSIADRRVSSRYIALMTPSQVRWKVRILQADPE